LDAAALDAAALDAGPPIPPSLHLNELMSRNGGAWIDEIGEADDWIELHNPGTRPLDLRGWAISDKPDEPHPIPAEGVAARGFLVLWADKEEAPLHLPFKLDGDGEALYLFDPSGAVVDAVEFGALAENESLQRSPDATGPWVACGWATPARANGVACGPPPPPDLPAEVTFAPYVWADPWPQPALPLRITELALGEGGFVELLNATAAPVDLSAFDLRLSAHRPGWPWPAEGEGVAVEGLTGRLEAGAYLALDLSAAAQAPLADDPRREGVISLWMADRAHPIERIDFMSWPEGAALARDATSLGPLRFCAARSPGEANLDCAPLAQRPVTDRLRHEYTPGDLDALAEGGLAVGIASVKFVLDREGGGAIHLLRAADWDLHYTFVREVIDGLPHLDRCDPEEEAIFTEGWRAFSQENYFTVEARRYLLGTLQRYGGSGLHTVEFTAGDQISAAQMRQAFFSLAARLLAPRAWALRPQTGEHVAVMLTIDGQAPIVDPNAPFRGLTYQPLTETVGYGVLTFVPSAALSEAPLGAQVIVVTDQVPNDIPLVGGLITEAFQTPLAHVNLLSRNRDTPNMALRGARDDPRLAPHFDQLVRLVVRGGGFEITPVEAAEADAFWQARRPEGPPQAPRLALNTRGVTPLTDRGLADLQAIGAKAAQLAELRRVMAHPECAFFTPSAPAAIPVVHSLEHYEASGARARLDALLDDPAFLADPRVRAEGLAAVQALILNHPVDPTLLAELTAYIDAWFGDERARLRSSSNTEDLPGFNGAGLYTSVSVQLNDPDLSVEDGLRAVWASLYRPRAFDERGYHNIDQRLTTVDGEAYGVAMGVLLHPAFLSERANGVAISRDVLEPIRGNYYLNVQRGEASVTNPAPGVSTEQWRYRLGRTPKLQKLAASSLAVEGDVLSEAELDHIACALRSIHLHFQPLLDPQSLNPWFAMDIELKLLGDERALLIKQARPYTFGATAIPEDCREL
ncbi:lamin tail domain-containing protein, partial [Myxococcota bacterium]|nr:lamin tail domain-containing protein [Myxococcota bacterium]MBU1896701.1 lamin tail domain-containing protein [Myxococcota bacterium]